MWWRLVVAAALAASLPPTAGGTHTTQDPDSVWVDIVDVSPVTEDEPEEVERRLTAELADQLTGAKAEALLLYTEYQARAATDMKIFIRNITGLKEETFFGSLEPGVLERAPVQCRAQLLERVGRAVRNAQRGAAFSAENHHKFFLGHMIVFRMHLNKSEEYIQKCDRVIKACGVKCESTPKVKRWRRLAAAEMNRVRDDVQHSRAAYRDLLAHAHRRLRTLRRHATRAASDAVHQFRDCVEHES